MCTLFLVALAFLGLAAFADAAPARVQVRVGRVRVAPVRVQRVVAIRRVVAPVVVRQAVVLRQRAVYASYAQFVGPVQEQVVTEKVVEQPVQKVILRQSAGYGCGGAAAIRVQRIRIY